MPQLKIWVHFVWSTKNREPMLIKEIRTPLFSHIRENARAKGIYLDFIGGYLDHVHSLISLGGEQSISRIAQLIKGESAHWVNQQSLLPSKLQWQDEYFAASVSGSSVDVLRDYIKNQEEHHRKKQYAEEYDSLLKEYGFESLRKG